MKLWEWSHMQPVQNVRPSGVFAKVNRVRFSLQGNKFGACDGDGNVALWQAANASAPFFVSTVKPRNSERQNSGKPRNSGQILAPKLLFSKKKSK